MLKTNITAIVALFIMMTLPTIVGTAAVREPDSVFVYKTAGDISLSMYVFYPQDWRSDDLRPLVVFFHGGGWRAGEPSQFFGQSAYLAHRGMVAISVEYRLGNKHGTTPRECVEDGKSALRWVREHAAKLGIDPEKIIAGGGSAGGHVAAAAVMLPGFDSPEDDVTVPIGPKAMVLFNPVIDTGPEGFGYNMLGEAWKDYSPSEHIRHGLPPILLLFGDKDPLFISNSMTRFLERMDQHGNHLDLKLYEGFGHGFFNMNNSEEAYRLTLIDTDRFLAGLGYLSGAPDEAYIMKQIDNKRQ